MATDNPDEAWYATQSRVRKLPPRCPIASITGCPRFFASVDHAQKAKLISGNIPGNVYDHLLEKWQAFDALLIDDLHVGTYYSPSGELTGAANFCPEVAQLLSGLYCSDFMTSPANRNEFTHLHGRHYSKCAEYSLLGYAEKDLSPVDRGITPEKRFAVLKRDGFKCVYCGRGAPDVLLHLDHKISRNDGGGDEVTNLVTACSLCNNGKGSQSAI